MGIKRIQSGAEFVVDVGADSIFPRMENPKGTARSTEAPDNVAFVTGTTTKLSGSHTDARPLITASLPAVFGRLITYVYNP
jgi:hypothetical protein